MSYGELVRDIGPDYKDKEIGYEAGYIDNIPTEYEEMEDEELKELNEWMDGVNEKLRAF